ncbi:hypothetical protein [Nocardioides terrae]|uniref:hypothetical protein n=1 Tax=Nocardioides terrae TaxID=574651 RepID=UPI001113E747|nr:hypothetical protein [Nocardioides terrae]
MASHRPVATARSAAKVAGLLLIGITLLVAPAAAAVLAVQLAPPAHVEIAGQDVTVRPVLGRNTTQVAGDAITRPEHGRIELGPIAVDVGLDLGVDWNRLIPEDKQTRQYLVALFDDPSPAIASIRSAARRQVLSWTVAAAVVVLATEVAVGALLWQRRKKLAAMPPSLADVVSAHNSRLRRLVVVTAVASLIALELMAGHTLLHRDERVVVGSPALAGTSLAGTQVEGLVADVIPFLAVLRPHSTFYDQVSDNLDSVLRDAAVRTDEDDVLFVEAEDLEDVNGMARIVGRAATLVEADFISFSGDLTFAGKPVESYLIDTIDYYSQGTPVEFSPGLHDTPAILRAATARGWHVADNRTHQVGDVSLLTLADPRVSTVGNFGAGTVPRDNGVDVDDFVEAAVEEACDSRPDVVVLHDHVLGQRIAESGCQDLVIDGRSFRRIGVQRYLTPDGGAAIEYTVGSAGGHVDTRPNPGPVQHRATFEVFSLDPESGLVQASVVTVRPDASVTVSEPIVVLEGQSVDEP